MFSIILIFMGGIFILFFIVAPLIVRFAVRMPARPKVSPVRPEELPSDALTYFNQSKIEMEGIGFVAVVDAVMEGFIRSMKTYFRLMFNRNAGDSVMFAYIETGSRSTRKIHKYTEFCTEFSSGKEIVTNNSSTNATIIPIPEKRVLQFPNILNLYELYQIHTRETANVDRFSKKVLPPEGTELEYLINSMNKDFERQAKMGYLSFDSLTNVYHPTFKGAYLMTWKTILVGKKR